MSSPAPFGAVAELFERSLNIRHVYGEPVRHGELTVIPVARVTYGFGAGGGRGPGHPRAKQPTEAAQSEPRPEAQGAGGGGVGHMTPMGAIEIGPHGTRFVQFNTMGPLLGAAAIGVVAGCLLMLLRSATRRSNRPG